MSYKVHLPDDALDQLEQERASDDGMPEPVVAERTCNDAYRQGRTDTYYRANRARNPFQSSDKLSQCWANGFADEMEEFA